MRSLPDLHRLISVYLLTICCSPLVPRTLAGTVAGSVQTGKHKFSPSPQLDEKQCQTILLTQLVAKFFRYHVPLPPHPPFNGMLTYTVTQSSSYFALITDDFYNTKKFARSFFLRLFFLIEPATYFFIENPPTMYYFGAVFSSSKATFSESLSPPSLRATTSWVTLRRLLSSTASISW
jgi:hypothetical protein